MRTDREANTKSIYDKWFIRTVVFAIVLVLLVMGLNILIDPYFHYHKPVTKYRLNEERYINDGIARNFDYDTIIIGNSLFQNFKTSQYDELNGTKSVKLPYSGAGIFELWNALGRAIGRNELKVDLISYDSKDGAKNVADYKSETGYKDIVKNVIICTDIEDVLRDYHWHRYNDYPTYLYDEDVLNDVKYLLNKDTLYRGTVNNIFRTVLGKESTSFDEYSSWVRVSGPEAACADISVIDPATDRCRRKLSDGDIEKIYYNIHTNMVPVIEANSDVKFKLLIPPASLGKWAEHYNKGEVAYYLDGMEYVLSILTDYDNVTVYGFDDEFSITNDLNRYCDAIHYDADVSEWIFEEISAGRHEINKDNYKEYVDGLREYYLNYDFTVLNEYISD